MTPEELLPFKRREPFEPFRLVLADGTTYSVYKPTHMMIGLWRVVVGLTRKPKQMICDRTVELDLSQILRVETLQAAAPPASGPA